jgi:hypothetical protein
VVLDRAIGHVRGNGPDGDRDITSGKPVLCPELPRFYGVMQTITSEVPKL